MKGKAISLQKRGEIMLRQRKSIDSQKGWHNVVTNVTPIDALSQRCHNSKQEQSEGLQSLAGRISHVYKLYI